jgi:hypothetical protein
MPTYPQLTVIPRPMRGPAGVFAIETTEHGEVAWLPMYHPDAERLARLFAAAPMLYEAARALLESNDGAQWQPLDRYVRGLRRALEAVDGPSAERPTPRTETCRVEGCGKARGVHMVCCPEHDAEQFRLWGFCDPGDCWRRIPIGAEVGCSIHGGQDYSPPRRTHGFRPFTADDLAEIAAHISARPTPPAEPADLCRVEGCGLPRLEGKSACAQHHEEVGVLWWFCGREWECWRRCPPSASTCSHHGGTDYAPTPEPHRCESRCEREAAPGARYCRFCSGQKCEVRGCAENSEDDDALCTDHTVAYNESPIWSYFDWLASLPAPTAPTSTRPAPATLPLPATVTTHGLPGGTDPGAVETALLAAGVPGGDGLDDEPAAPTGHRCEYAGCIAEAQDGARCCRAHICPNLCNVRWCEGMYDGLLCSAHRLAYLASPLNYYNWLASLTPPPPAPAPAIRAGDLVAVDSGGTVRTANAGSPVLGVAMGTAAPGETVTVALHNLPGCPAFVSFVASGERVGFALEWVEDPAPDARARYLAGLTPAQRAGLAPLGGGR